MPLTLTCPHCNRPMQAPNSASGKQVRCPYCQAVLDVPPPKARPLLEALPADDSDFEKPSLIARHWPLFFIVLTVLVFLALGIAIPFLEQAGLIPQSDVMRFLEGRQK